ncbi:hypothetical protein Tco_0844668, partial [Tanacetum coccineum]
EEDVDREMITSQLQGKLWLYDEVRLDFAKVQDDETTLTFLLDLGYKGPLHKHPNMYVDHMHQPWRTLAAIINKCLSSKAASNDRLRESKIDIIWGMFYRENEYGLPIPETMLNKGIKQSESYQMFIKNCTGQIPPKKSRGKGSQGKKTADTSEADADVSEESDSEHARKQTSSRRVTKKKVTISADDNIIPDPDVALELGKSISLTEAAEEEAARQVHVTHARIMIESVLKPAKRRPSGIAFRDTSSVSNKMSSDPSQKLKGVQTLTPEEHIAADIMKSLKEMKDSDEEKVTFEANVILEWGSEQESEYSEEDDDDDNDDDDDDDDDNDNDDKSIDLEKIDDEETDDEFVHMNDDEDEEMTNAEDADTGNGDEENTDAAKADVEKTKVVKDEIKKAKLPPKSSSLFVSPGFVIALPPREQRHPFLRYQGLEYTDAVIVDFESRLTWIYQREGQSVFTSQAWRRLFDIRGPLVHELILEFFSTFRFGEAVIDLDIAGALQFQLGGAKRHPNKGDLRDYWIGISSVGDFLGTTPSYTMIRDPILRLCHRLIACSIAGRSQAPEKVTVTDLFYLRGMDVGSFVAGLAEHFRLLTAEILQGLTIIAPKLLIIDIAKLVRLQICMEIDDTWDWVAMGPER